MNRNVPKIEWAIELAPVPGAWATEIGSIALHDLPGWTPADAAPLEKAGIKNTDDFLALATGTTPQRYIDFLCTLEGVGEKRAEKIRNLFARALMEILRKLNPPTGWCSSIETALAALDRAAEFSHGQLVLSTGYPRLLDLDGKTYIVIRWGGAALHQQYYLRLVKTDPRFHKCPPLSNADTGMAGCWKEP